MYINKEPEVAAKMKEGTRPILSNWSGSVFKGGNWWADSTVSNFWCGM